MEYSPLPRAFYKTADRAGQRGGFMLKSEYLQRVYSQVVTRDPDQKEFHQAVLEFLESLDQDRKSVV